VGHRFIEILRHEREALALQPTILMSGYLTRFEVSFKVVAADFGDTRAAYLSASLEQAAND
jgi:hypothetical protein